MRKKVEVKVKGEEIFPKLLNRLNRFKNLSHLNHLNRFKYLMHLKLFKPFKQWSHLNHLKPFKLFQVGS
jgi:hypothetical protein